MASSPSMHPHHALRALDHIDGLLGDFMHQAKNHIASAQQHITMGADNAGPEAGQKHPMEASDLGPASKTLGTDAPDTQSNTGPLGSNHHQMEASEPAHDYDGKNNPGGHTGHPFGGKDQHGAANHHFEGHGMPESSEEVGGVGGNPHEEEADQMSKNLGGRGRPDGGMGSLRRLLAR